MNLGPGSKGRVTAKVTIRDKDGNVKGSTVLVGETNLSEEELRKALDLDSTVEKKNDSEL